jgi:nucleotide-binding universal stress UspA family protein
MMTPAAAMQETQRNEEVAPHLATTALTLHRILVALDLSEQSAAVLNIACQVAQRFDAELLLLHAATPTVFLTGTVPEPVELYQLNLADASERLGELMMREPRMSSLRHSEIVAYGAVSDLAQKAVLERGIDLIIVGTHAARGLEKMAFGSFAETILHEVRCPLLFVGPEVQTSHDLFRSILFASSLNPAELRAAQYATSLAETFHSELTMLHVDERPPVPGRTTPDAFEVDGLRMMSSQLPTELSQSDRVTLRIERGKAGEVVPALVNREGISLVVTGVREVLALAGHNSRSTMSQIVRECHCPVLAVRSQLT